MKRLNLRDATQKLFAHRPDEAYTLDEVFGQFQRWKAKAFRFKRGEICFRAGAPAREFAAVVQGVLYVRMPSLIGEDILIGAVRPGEYVGLPLIYSREESYPFDVTAASATEIVTFDVDEVRKWRADPDSRPLFDHIGRLMGKIIRDSQIRSMVLDGKNVSERLRRYLAVRMKRDGSCTVAIPGSSRDLANYLGVNSCALSRTIGRLRAAGKIEFRRNVFTVLGSGGAFASEEGEA